MTDKRVAVAVTTWTRGAMLQTTLENIPPDVRTLVVDTREQRWPLAKGWNFALDTLFAEGFECVVVMNDDVVLRHDTLDILAEGLLDAQHDPKYPTLWNPPYPRLLLLSARHASPSDACTDRPDWALLGAMEPMWQPGPDFSCFAVGREFVDVIGRFDECFEAYFEDNSAHRRIQLAGYEGGALAPMWHHRNGTIRTDAERRAAASRIYERSRLEYCRMWGAPYDNQLPMGRETFVTPYGR